MKAISAYALFRWSLRVNACRLEAHLARMVTMMGAYLAIAYLAAMIPFFGASGLKFVSWISYFDIVTITIVGTSFFASAITEEREEGILGLLLLTGIHPFEILVGKLAGRLWECVFLLAIQYPFLLFAASFGGVTFAQIRELYITLFAYSFMLAGIGMFCSTLFRSHPFASSLTLVVVVMYHLVTVYCDRLVLNYQRMSVPAEVFFTTIARSSVFTRCGEILISAQQPALVSTQVLSNLLMGSAAVGLSWLIFDRKGFIPDAAAGSRSGVAPAFGRWRWSKPGRVHGNALAWKDFHFILGGKVSLVLRVVVYALLYPLVMAFVQRLFLGTWPPEAERTALLIYVWVVIVVAAADAGKLISDSLYEEVQCNTLGTLMMAKYSTGGLFYSKVLGLLPAFIPPALILAAALTLFPFSLDARTLFTSQRAMTSYAIAHLVLIPHAAAAWAINGKRNGLILGMLTAIASLVSTSTLVAFAETGRVGPRSLMTVSATAVVIAFCGCCHYVVWKQAQRQL